MALDPKTIKYLLAKMNAAGVRPSPGGQAELTDDGDEPDAPPLKKMVLGADYSGEPVPPEEDPAVKYAGEPVPQFKGELRDPDEGTVDLQMGELEMTPTPPMQARATMEYEADPDSDELPDEEPDLETPEVPRFAAAMPTPLPNYSGGPAKPEPLPNYYGDRQVVELDNKRKPLPAQAPPIPKVVPSYGKVPGADGPTVLPGSDTERMLRKRDYTGEGSNTPGGEEALAGIRNRNRLGAESAQRSSMLDGKLTDMLMDKFAGPRGIDEDFAEGARASAASAPGRVAALRGAASPSGVAANAAMGTKDAGPIRAPPRSVRNVTKQGISIGDRNMTLEGAPQPGIGLSMTGDRHASLRSEETIQNPQQPSAAPPPAPVVNPQAQAVAAQSQKPQDNSAYYRALRNVEDGAWQGIGKSPDQHSVQDELIGQEGQKQKDYRSDQARQQAALTAALKQKYDDGWKTKDLNEKQQHNRALENQSAATLAQTQAWRTTQDANADEQRENTKMYRDALLKNQAARININVGGADARFDAGQAQRAVKAMPQAGETQSLNDVLATLEQGTAPGTGYFMNRDGWQSFLRTPKGGAFRQAVLSVINPHIKRQHGAAVPAGEEERAMGQFGYGSFNSPQELESGMRRIAMEQDLNVEQIMGSIRPNARRMLEEGGAVPRTSSKKGRAVSNETTPVGRDTQDSFNPMAAVPGVSADQMNQNGSLNGVVNPAGEAFKGVGPAVYNFLSGKYADPKDAVRAAQAQQDEEERKRIRASWGTGD